MPGKRPLPLINCLIFSNPSTLSGPLFITFKQINFFANSPPYLLSLLVPFTPNFQSQMVCFFIYFSLMLSTNLFLFFPALYNHLKPFLKGRPPFIFPLPPFIEFQNFFQPPCLLRPLRFLALESMCMFTAIHFLAKLFANVYSNPQNTYTVWVAITVFPNYLNVFSLLQLILVLQVIQYFKTWHDFLIDSDFMDINFNCFIL